MEDDSLHLQQAHCDPEAATQPGWHLLFHLCHSLVSIMRRTSSVISGVWCGRHETLLSLAYLDWCLVLSLVSGFLLLVDTTVKSSSMFFWKQCWRSSRVQFSCQRILLKHVDRTCCRGSVWSHFVRPEKLLLGWQKHWYLAFNFVWSFLHWPAFH